MNYNGGKDKNKLRKQQINNNQRKLQFNCRKLQYDCKKSLSKRIIQERIEILTRQRIYEHSEILEFNERLEQLYDEVQYKVTHYQRLICEDYATTRTFAEIVTKGDKLLKQFYDKEIDIKECIKGWEELNEQITNIIQNWENSSGSYII